MGACLIPVFENITVPENTENTIVVFSENCSCFLDLVFFMFFRTVKNWQTNMFSLFLKTENNFQKQKPTRPYMSSSFTIDNK